MNKNKQWSIRSFFLAVLFGALLISQLTGIYQSYFAPIADFSPTVMPEYEEWLKEIDPTVTAHEGARVTPPVDKYKSIDHLAYCVYTSKNTTSIELLNHLRSKIKERLADEDWSNQQQTTYGNNSFVFTAYKRGTILKLYVGLAANGALSNAAKKQQELGATVTTIKVYQIGFRSR